MKVGCFALVSPFSTLNVQLDELKNWGFKYADLTDNSDGACLGNEYGFTALASLDANPFDLKRMFEERGITMTSVCGHANLLDPSAPWRYGTSQLLKAVKIAAAIGVKHVITSEGDPKTDFGHSLTEDEAIFTIAEKLHEPLRLAEDFGVKILIEPHGKYSDSLKSTEKILKKCNSPALGLNLDTGNLWLGGGEPVKMIEEFGNLIEHVHWKDLPEEYIAQRGKIFGCGMSTIPLGTGVVGIEKIYNKLKSVGFDGYTTLEIAGKDAVIDSYNMLKKLGAE